MSLYNIATDILRQRLSRAVGDCILTTSTATGTSTTIKVATFNPPWFYGKANDYFNKEWYEVYCYEGTNIGTSTYASDYDTTTHTITVGNTQSSAYDATSKCELHRLFTVQDYYDAINAGINTLAKSYYFWVDDRTSTTLVESTGNDGNTIYTYEYSIPTSLLYICRLTIEGAVSGTKLTGTISGDFTLGETVTGSSSGASGVLSYGPSTASYILVREVSGTFTTSDTVTGATSEETVTSITSVDSETVGDGTFPVGNILEGRDWDIIRIPGGDKIQLDKRYINVTADLRLEWEGLGVQAEIDDDTDSVYTDIDWLLDRAIANLPIDSIEVPEKIARRYSLAVQRSAIVPHTIVPVGARKVFE